MSVKINFIFYEHLNENDMSFTSVITSPLQSTPDDKKDHRVFVEKKSFTVEIVLVVVCNYFRCCQILNIYIFFFLVCKMIEKKLLTINKRN